jgi:hypothetical protein
MTAGNTPEAWQHWLPRIYTGYAIGVGVSVAGAFTESFANLITYFRHAGLSLGLAIIAPSMIDIFTIGGETLVLIATVKHWPTRYKIGGWIATFAGLAVSVAGNVGKDGWRHLDPNRAVAYAIAPLALAGLLALGLAIVKRVLIDEEEAAVPAATPDVPADTSTPDVRADTPAAITAAITAASVPAAAARPRPAPAKTATARPGKVTPGQVRALRDQGLTPADVAARLGLSRRQERRLANPGQTRVLASANGSAASSNGSGS